MSHLKKINAYIPHNFKNAAFLPHYSEKFPHIYRIILKNYRMPTAFFKKITACLPHVFLP